MTLSQTRSSPRPTSGTEPAAGNGSHQWAVVLDEVEGARFRPLIRHLFGDDRPKQYVPLLGARSLFRQTLDRVALLVPPARTIIVSQPRHARYLAADLDDGDPRVLFQPHDRGTGAGVLYSAHSIQRLDPTATVVVFPSAHFAVEETAFMAHVAAVAEFVARYPEWLVLLGAQATEPDPQYGWIRAGEPVAEAADGLIRRVSGFREKPDGETARVLLAEGWCWNTFVFVSSVATLMRAGRELLAPLQARLEQTVAFAGTEHERWAIRQAYALAPACDFSRDVFQACPSFLAVSTLPSLTWFDLGTPDRLVRLFHALYGWPPPARRRSWRGPSGTAAGAGASQ